MKSKVSFQIRIAIYPETFEEQKHALLKYVDSTPIDEVIFMVPHVEQNSSGLAKLEECQLHSEILKPLFVSLRERHIEVSINWWWTMGFSNFSSQERDQREAFDLRWAVNQYGIQSHAVACPRDKQWLEYVTSLYRCYAPLQPRVFWIDDDVRATLREKMDSSCFCDDCIDTANQRLKTNFTREELRRAIMADPPNLTRNGWLDFQNEIILNIGRTLREAIHTLSPKTRVGQMHSPLEEHWAEGRRFNQYLDALSTPKARAVVRPHLGPYQESIGAELMRGFNHTRLARFALPPDIEGYPEIENTPHTRFTKSLTFTELQITLGQILGLSGVTLSLYPFDGRLDHIRDTGIQEMLMRCRPRLQEIANLNIQREEFRGIGLPWHEDEAHHATGLSNTLNHNALVRRRPWDTSLPLLGFATFHGISNVNAIAGEMIAAMDEEELVEIFSRGVLLDARAAATLIRMGRGSWAGLTGINKPAPGTRELMTDSQFGGIKDDAISIRGEKIPWQFGLLDNVKVISHIYGYNRTCTGHGIVLYENKLGGRTAVVPYDGQEGAIDSFTFRTFSRQAQFTNILQWLGKGSFPHVALLGLANAVPLIIHQEKSMILVIVNLSSDEINPLTLKLGQSKIFPTRIEGLQEDGMWQPIHVKTINIGTDTYHLTTNLSVPYLKVALLRIS